MSRNAEMHATRACIDGATQDRKMGTATCSVKNLAGVYSSSHLERSTTSRPAGRILMVKRFKIQTGGREFIPDGEYVEASDYDKLLADFEEAKEHLLAIVEGDTCDRSSEIANHALGCFNSDTFSEHGK